MGYPLLIENEEHTFRVYPKQHRSWSQPKDIVIQNQMMNLGQVTILDPGSYCRPKEKGLLIKKLP